MLKLSICISTFNRAKFIGETLESIIPQLSSECEVIVSDNASMDDTQNVVERYTRECARIKYIRQEDDLGVDRNYDRAIDLAVGQYCWLLSDDDPLKPDAVRTVLTAIAESFSLIIANSEVRDVRLERVLKERFIQIDADRIYGSGEMDRLFSDLEPWLNFISSYIIERSIWNERERSRYFGSLFVFVGVVFQRSLPGSTLVIAKPLVTCRFGNEHTFWHKVFEVATISWPSLVWSLGISESAKKATPREPWRNITTLLMWRGIGAYTLTEFRRLIKPRLSRTSSTWIPIIVSVIPRSIANGICTLYFSYAGNNSEVLIILKGSRFYVGSWFRRWVWPFRPRVRGGQAVLRDGQQRP